MSLFVLPLFKRKELKANQLAAFLTTSFAFN